MASIGSAVGLGNVWRFPYIAGVNRGGAYIIAYLLAVVVLRFPLMVLEVSAGRMEAGSMVTTLRRINPRASRFLIPILLVILVGLAVYALTLPGRGQAMDFYVNPGFSRRSGRRSSRSRWEAAYS